MPTKILVPILCYIKLVTKLTNIKFFHFIHQILNPSSFLPSISPKINFPQFFTIHFYYSPYTFLPPSSSVQFIFKSKKIKLKLSLSLKTKNSNYLISFPSTSSTLFSFLFILIISKKKGKKSQKQKSQKQKSQKQERKVKEKRKQKGKKKEKRERKKKIKVNFFFFNLNLRLPTRQPQPPISHIIGTDEFSTLTQAYPTHGSLCWFVRAMAVTYPPKMYSPFQQAKLLIILKECQKSMCLHRVKNKLNCKCTNNLNETEYNEEFDIDSKPTTLVEFEKLAYLYRTQKFLMGPNRSFW